MRGNCKQCCNKIANEQAKIPCKECQFFFHGSYVNLSVEDFTFITAESEVRRDTCSRERQKSMRADSELSKSDPNLTDVIVLLQEMRSKNKQIK